MSSDVTESSQWNRRYGGDSYLFGTEPSLFLVSVEALLPRHASILCVADGEGRNGAWLAAQGHTVTAFDVSERAHQKARALDAQFGVTVARHVAGVDDWEFVDSTWDVIVAVMVQFAPPAMRERMFQNVKRATRPGGLALVHGYTPPQIAFGTGGPPHVENLYTARYLAQTFDGWQIERLDEYETQLSEGAGHHGRSAVVDLVARRPDAN